MDFLFSWLGLGVLCLGASSVLWVVMMFKTSSDPRMATVLDGIRILLLLIGFSLVAFFLISFTI